MTSYTYEEYLKTFAPKTYKKYLEDKKKTDWYSIFIKALRHGNS